MLLESSDTESNDVANVMCDPEGTSFSLLVEIQFVAGLRNWPESDQFWSSGAQSRVVSRSWCLWQTQGAWMRGAGRGWASPELEIVRGDGGLR